MNLVAAGEDPIGDAVHGVLPPGSVPQIVPALCQSPKMPSQRAATAQATRITQTIRPAVDMGSNPSLSAVMVRLILRRGLV